MTAANRQQIAEMIRAYGRATPVLEEERLRWLTQLTPQEARAIYESLYEAWVCPVDCISHLTPDQVKLHRYDRGVHDNVPPVQIRFDECIGCD
ncbi:MAG: hypothetical protein F9K13_07705, partial [Candidatus Methylomirabilis oxygeniifera]